MVIIIEATFVIAPTHIVVGMRSKPKTPRGTNIVSVHIEMPKEVNKVFVGQPLDVGGGGLDPPRHQDL
jgi:hypothetical protein